MGINITGRDPAAASWPIKGAVTAIETQPTGFTATGGTAVAVLNDGLDTTYDAQTGTNQYIRARVAATSLPQNSRLFYVVPKVRGRRTAGNTNKQDALIGVGDHSNKGIRNDNWKTSGGHYAVTAAFSTYAGKNVLTNSLGKPMSQDDLTKGLYVIFGLNTVYGTLAAGAQYSEVYMSYQYDMAPTATITSPTGTIADSSAPVITWDYFDDFQPQAKYRLTITNTGTSTVVYDSGLVVSSNTAHSVPFNLPNATYRADLRVYQAWPYAGGDFPATSVASSTFTVAVLKLSVPRIRVVDNPTIDKESAKVIVYPEINLLDNDSSTFDRGTLAWFSDSSNASIGPATTPVKDGTQSGKVTMTSTSGYVSTKKLAYNVLPGDRLNAIIYVNPLALSGRTAQLCIEWLTSNGTFIAESTGSVTSLPTNTWTAVQIANVTNLTSTVAFAQLRVRFASTVNGDNIYLDDAALWYANGAYRNNDATQTSWEGGSGVTWTAVGGSTLSIDSTKAQFGSNSLKIQLPTAGSAGVGAQSSTTTVRIGKKRTVSAYVWIPSGAPDVRIEIDGNIGPNSAGVRNQWTRIYCTYTPVSTSVTTKVTTSVAYTGSPIVWVDGILHEEVSALLPWFNGSSAGGFWDGSVDASTSHLLDSFPVWSRGGFFEFTPNLLSDANSSFENDGYTWAPLTSLSGSTMTKSSAQWFVGNAFSMILSKSTAGTNDIAMTIGAPFFLPCTAGQIFRGQMAAFSDTVARTVNYKINFFDANFAALSSQILSVGTTVGSWIFFDANFLAAPASSAYMNFEVRVLAVATTTEKHYFDGLGYYDSALGYTGYWSGYNNPANTDVAPTLRVEFSDDGVNWSQLGDETLLDDNTPYVVYQDYSLRSGVARQYRAVLEETENGFELNSDYTTPTSTVSRILQNVWMSSDDDPAGTSYNFQWDGGGRSEVIDVLGELVDIEGREFPFPQFGEHSRATVDVALMLETAADQQALMTLAQKRSTVVFRDQRMRAYRGMMGAVNFQDIPSTGMQRASFTLQVSGDQV